MTDITRVLIPEIPVPGKPLGRHVEHDPASRAFALPDPEGAVVRNTVVHKRHGVIFDQGDLGSCTGNALAGLVNTEPLYLTDWKKLLYEPDAVALYHEATVLDGFPGEYPPDDTGSSGLAAAKAAIKAGYCKKYQHAFTGTSALTSLQSRSGATGVNWYEGFDTPDANGLVKISGQIRGGHEFEIIGYHVTSGKSYLDDHLEAVNSWSKTWGKAGHFFFTVRTWFQLLSEQGDFTVIMG
jgi:hypothetical protein